MPKTKRWMTQAEYAKHRGRSRQYINQLAKAGVLVMRNGKVDSMASDAVLDDRVDGTVARVVRSTADELPAKPTPAEAKLASLILTAKRQKVDLEERMRQLVRCETVQAKWAEKLAALRDRLMALPSRVAVQCAGRDERVIADLLSTEIGAALSTATEHYADR